MSTEESLYSLSYEARPNPEMENPQNNLGAVITCFLRAESWEQAEAHLLALLPAQGWIPEKELNRGLVNRSDMSPSGLPWFDQAAEHGISLKIEAWDEEDPAPAEQPDPLTEEMISWAHSVAEQARQSGVDLDYSEDSLRRLDDLIPVLHPQGANFDSTYLVYTAYTGEVLRRNLGGHWRQTEEHGLFFEGANFKAGPLKWVKEKFADPANTSLAFKYKVVKSLGTGQDSPLSTEAPPPVAVPLKEEDDSEEEVKSIHQAPLIVFLLVAAADGKVDPKEGLKFKEIMEKSANHPNRLFKVAVGAMQSDFENNLQAAVGAGFIAWPVMLAKARIAAENIFPEDAPGFCQALLDMGQSIAKSSGGLLGFGGVGKEEKAALSIVAGMLGLK